MQSLSRFKVDEFCPLLSDVHSPLLIHIDTFNENAILPPTFSEEKIKHWSNDKNGDFLNSIDGDKIQAILNDLDGNIDKTRINVFMFDLENILLDAAKASIGTLKPRKQKSPNKAAWFDNKCKAARNIVHNDRKRHSNHKSPANRNAMLNSSKQYKKV